MVPKDLIGSPHRELLAKMHSVFLWGKCIGIDNEFINIGFQYPKLAILAQNNHEKEIIH